LEQGIRDNDIVELICFSSRLSRALEVACLRARAAFFLDFVERREGSREEDRLRFLRLPQNILR
jgi:hypothetical protein